MKNYISLLAITALTITSCFSCKKVTDNTQVCKDVVCTYEFRSVEVKVTNQKGEFTKLDDYYTVRKSTGDTMRYQTVALVVQDSYVVLNDVYRKQLENQRDIFHFIGVMNGKVVIDQPYTISADCCHINKELGPNTILY